MFVFTSRIAKHPQGLVLVGVLVGRLRLAVYAVVLVLIALRLLRTFAAIPAKPVPSSTTVAGSGMVLIVPLKSRWEFVVPLALKVSPPVAMRLPLAAVKSPVPPVSVNISERAATPVGGGSGSATVPT